MSLALRTFLMHNEVTIRHQDDINTALNLQPSHQPATPLSASFDGDGADSATATALAPNGTQYAVSTTIHYSNKPASNATFLTVQPQSTTATVQTKTPGQMHQA